jgi:hypothetical protein
MDAHPTAKLLMGVGRPTPSGFPNVEKSPLLRAFSILAVNSATIP